MISTFELANSNTMLDVKLKELDQCRENLQYQRNTIQSSRAYMFWQKYNIIKKGSMRLLHQPSKIPKVVNILATQGLDGLTEALRFDDPAVRFAETTNNQYLKWYKENYPTQDQIVGQKAASRSFSNYPLISIITPTYNTPIQFLIECIESVQAQSYPNWELCIADDCSSDPDVRKTILAFAKEDDRIRHIFRKTNGNICHASNTALKLARGEWVCLLDHDDILWPNAFFEVVKLVNDKPDAEFIYSNEDKLSENSLVHSDPFFKPDWSPDLLQSFMYTGHLSLYKRHLVEEVGNFEVGLEYSQDYDMAFKISEKTDQIYHLDKVLYSWRIHARSQAGGGKPFARTSNLLALANHMKRIDLAGKVVEYPYANKYDYKIKNDNLISIIIPSDNKQHIRGAVKTITDLTSYNAYEIIIVTNSVIAKSEESLCSNSNVHFEIFDQDFNFSKKCNLGASKAKGRILVFLNDDVQIISKDWIERIIEPLERTDVGAVSPKLIYENRTIQYAGMVTSVRGFFGTAFHAKPEMTFNYFNLAQSTRNVSILCGACFAIKKEVFSSVHGFDEINTPINHSDIDLSFKIRDKKLLIVYTPFATLMHKGHQSIGMIENKLKVQYPDLYILQRWPAYISYDPYFPPLMRDLLYGQGSTPFRIVPARNNGVVNPKRQFLFISHESTLTGAPLLISWLASELKKYQIFVLFIVPSEGELVSYLSELNIPVIIDGEITSFVRGETRQFYKNFDLVLSNTIFNHPSVMAALESGVRSAYFIHETPDYFTHQNIRCVDPVIEIPNFQSVKKALLNSDILLFSSKEVRSQYNQILPLKNGHIITPVVPPLVHPLKSTNSNKYFNILSVGSIEPRKGQIDLIKAFALLPKHMKSIVKINFIGNILDEKYYESLKQYKRQNITFRGSLRPKDVERWFLMSNLYICTSRAETGPLTVLEAAKYHVPIISTKVGIVNSLIIDDKNGMLYESTNEVELSQKIIAMFKSPKIRAHMAEGAYAIFSERYSSVKLADEFLKIIESY